LDAGAGDDLVFGDSVAFLAVQATAGTGSGQETKCVVLHKVLSSGPSGRDTILGGDGDDILFGQAGDDVICGGAGKDWLIGGDGHDWLYGGPGRDRTYKGENCSRELREKVLARLAVGW
jgi:Ca2+-binding RTX toxin-like protein